MYLYVIFKNKVMTELVNIFNVHFFLTGANVTINTTMGEVSRWRKVAVIKLVTIETANMTMVITRDTLENGVSESFANAMILRNTNFVTLSILFIVLYDRIQD